MLKKVFQITSSNTTFTTCKFEVVSIFRFCPISWFELNVDRSESPLTALMAVTWYLPLTPTLSPGYKIESPKLQSTIFIILWQLYCTTIWLPIIGTDIFFHLADHHNVPNLQYLLTIHKLYFIILGSRDEAEHFIMILSKTILFFGGLVAIIIYRWGVGDRVDLDINAAGPQPQQQQLDSEHPIR